MEIQTDMAHARKVLYIGTPIFNYHRRIIEELERQGCVVDHYNDRPGESSVLKGLIKTRRQLVSPLIRRYFSRILRETGGRTYDLVFVVNCKVFTPGMIAQLRDSQRNARFVLYMWDSLALYPDARALIPLFDKVFSFDSDDCDNVPQLELLPLFYSPAYGEIGASRATSVEHDIVSVCTAHPNRYRTMRELFPALEARGIRVFSYMFLNRLQFLYNKVIVNEFRDAKASEFRFTPLTEAENLEVLRKSSTVFDMQHDSQSGLTMRAIESLGARRKLITTNANIRKYDFHTGNNVYVLDDSNRSGIEEFIRRDWEPIDEAIYQKYSLRSWIKRILAPA